MQSSQKSEIQKLLSDFCETLGSQSAAAKRLDDVSEATISQMLKNNWQNISDAMWRNVGKQVGWNHHKTQQFVETLNAQTLLLYFETAKEHGETFAITATAGSGKTFVGQHYARAMRGKNVYHLECAEYLNRRYFLIELMKIMGLPSGGMNIYEMMEEIISTLRSQDHPLIIMDEVDKLKPEVLLFFITLYNKLHGLCGIVWTSTSAIVTKIDKGVHANKIGYNEIFSRIGRRFITLPGLNKKEAEAICAGYDITDPTEVSSIWNESEGDIRRIDRNDVKNKMKNRRA